MRRLAVAFLAVAVAAAGCTGDDGPADADPGADPTRPAVEVTRADPPRPFRAGTTTAPPGYVVAQCSDLRREVRNTGLASRFLVPPRYAAYDRRGASCAFQSTTTFGLEFYVSFQPQLTLEGTRERDVEPNVGVGGDSEMGEVAYDPDVRVFGRHRGERLDYYCYCDGQQLDYTLVQTHGLRLTWITPHGKRQRHEAAYDVLASSMALVRSDLSTCRSRGRAVLFRPPIPQTESVDSYSDRCHLYLRPGRSSLHRYAEIELRPPMTLAERALRVGNKKHVVSVRLEPGAGTLDGQRADRLTWVVERTAPGPYDYPTGRWRAVTLGTDDLWVTWTARPGQWRTEADDARRFYESVRPLP